MKFEPGHIVSDFEMPLIKAVKQKLCLSSNDTSILDNDEIIRYYHLRA